MPEPENNGRRRANMKTVAAYPKPPMTQPLIVLPVSQGHSPFERDVYNGNGWHLLTCPNAETAAALVAMLNASGEAKRETPCVSEDDLNFFTEHG